MEVRLYSHGYLVVNYVLVEHIRSLCIELDRALRLLWGNIIY